VALNHLRVSLCTWVAALDILQGGPPTTPLLRKFATVQQWPLPSCLEFRGGGGQLPGTCPCTAQKPLVIPQTNSSTGPEGTIQARVCCISM
jgi:hypothetical protein